MNPFNQDEIFCLMVCAVAFGIGTGLLLHGLGMNSEASTGVGIISSIPFGFLLGLLVKWMRAIL